MAQANILAGAVPGATIRCLCGERERVRGPRRRAGAAMGADGAVPPLTLSGCRTSEPTGWGVPAQARRGRRRAPGCSAAEGGGARRQGHFVPTLLAAAGGARHPVPLRPAPRRRSRELRCARLATGTQPGGRGGAGRALQAWAVTRRRLRSGARRERGREPGGWAR